MLKHQSLLILALVLAVLVGGCSAAEAVIENEPEPVATETPRPLYSFDFEPVCVGQGVAAATPYNAEDGVNKVVIFSREGRDESYLEQTIFVGAFPSEEWLPEFEQYEAAELVACLTVIEREFVESCEYTSEEDDTVSQLETYNTTYEATLYEATTGEVLASQTLYGASDDCPMFAFFSGDEVKIHDGEPTDDLIDFLRPYVEP